MFAEQGLVNYRATMEKARACLIVQEQAMHYTDSFGSRDALKLGNALAELSGEYDRGVTAIIVRESDSLVLFSFASDDKTPLNAKYAEGKRAATRLCGHASLMCYVEHELDGAWDEQFACAARQKKINRENPEAVPVVPAICPVGGALPIFVGERHVATLAVSGLHEGLDHELATRAICRALDLEYGLDVPAYTYPAI